MPAINDNHCPGGQNYGCFGQGSNETGIDKVDNATEYNNWPRNILLAKEGGVTEFTYVHPPIVGPTPMRLDDRAVDIPNKYVKDLYIKYPFLIPSEIPQEPTRTIQRGYTSKYEDLTTYQEDFCHMGPELPQLVGARGLSLPEGEKPPNRLPGIPYIPRSRNPLPAHDQVDKVRLKQEKANKGKVLQQIPPMPKRISEYEDNFNLMVKSWQKHGVYTEPEVYIQHKHTLPP